MKHYHSIVYIIPQIDQVLSLGRLGLDLLVIKSLLTWLMAAVFVEKLVEGKCEAESSSSSESSLSVADVERAITDVQRIIRVIGDQVTQIIRC